MLELEPGSVEHVAHPEDPPHSPVGIWLMAISKYFALSGGLLFVALITMSIISIVGRKLIAWPVPGDLEMMQMGAAVAAATFFPYCQMVDGHVKVDFFTTHLSPRTKGFLDGTASLLIAFVAFVIAWRTYAGAMTAYESQEASIMLLWPIWIPIMLIVPSFILFGLTGLYIARRRFRITLGGAK